MREEEQEIEIHSKASLDSRFSVCSPKEDSSALWDCIKCIIRLITLSLIIFLYLLLFLVSFIQPIFYRDEPLIGIEPRAVDINWLFCFQISLFIFEFTCLITSFLLIHLTKEAEVPDDPIWSLKASMNHSPQGKMEEIALKFIQRSAYLNQSHNRLFANHHSNEPQLEGSTITSSQGNSSVAYDDYYIVNERKANKDVRYCKKCSKFKPDRAHHCSQCNKCYLKLDHHSLWFNRCISYSNHKHYLTFFFYGWNISLLFLIEFCFSFIASLRSEQPLKYKICICIAYSFTLILFAVLFHHWRFNIVLVLNNFTLMEYMLFMKKEDERQTLSYCQIDPEAVKASNSSMRYASRYYISKWENWLQFFGDNPFTWFVPITSQAGNDKGGFNFKMNNFNAIEVINSI